MDHQLHTLQTPILRDFGVSPPAAVQVKDLPWGDPDTWFALAQTPPQHPLWAGVSTYQFDFTANWKTWSVANELWLKRVTDTDTACKLWSGYETVSEHLLHEKSNLENLHNAVAPAGFQLAAVVFPDEPVSYWQSRPRSAPALIRSPVLADGSTGISEKWTMEDLTRQLAIRSGKHGMSIGRKRLLRSTSGLESFMSSRQMWPGDCDMLIVKDGVAAAVVEFKRHNLSRSLPERWTLESHDLYKPVGFKGRGRRGSDGLKYDGLALLADRLHVPLIVVCWPAVPEVDYTLVYNAIGGPGSLSIHDSQRVPMRSGSNQPDVVSNILARV